MELMNGCMGNIDTYLQNTYRGFHCESGGHFAITSHTIAMPDEVVLREVASSSDDRTAINTEDELMERYGVKETERGWKEEAKRALKRKLYCSSQRVRQIAKGVFPPLDWIPKYKVRESLVGDIIAGLTVGVVHLPQGMAYGLLSSLPPVAGLYVSFFPVLVYVFFGTSRQVSIGTFAVVSLMIAQVINENVTPCPGIPGDDTAPSVGSDFSTPPATLGTSAAYMEMDTTMVGRSCQADLDRRKMELAVALAMANGIIQVAMSILRLGIVTSYLSTHLVSGFTCGAAFHVLTSQAFKLLGIDFNRFNGPLALIYSWIDLFRNITTINWATVVISAICIIFLIIGKVINDKFKDRLPIPLPWELGVVVFGTVASYKGDFRGKYGVGTVGNIPTGIELSIPKANDIGVTILGAFPIAIVAFATEISLSQMFATKHSYKIDSNQELLAMGIGNMVGSFFSCFPSAPSLSRSVICDEAGARTQLYGIFSSALILVVLLWIGPLFESLPQAALAAIIVVNLKGLLRQFEKIPTLWRVRRLDAITWVFTWLSVVLLGVSIGLGVAVAFQVFTIVLGTQFTSGVSIGPVGASQEYRDVRKYRTKANDFPNITVFRFPGPVIFVNAERFKSGVYKSLALDPTTIASKHKDDKNTEEVSQQQVRNSNPVYLHDDGTLGNTDPEGATSHQRTDSSENGFIEGGAVNGASTNDIETNEPVAQNTPADRKTHVAHFVLDLSSCPYIDNDGAKAIKSVHLALKSAEVKLLLAACNDQVRQVFNLACEKECPTIYTSIESAVRVARGDAVFDIDGIEGERRKRSNADDTRL